MSKNKIIFIISSLLFVLGISFSFMVYLRWDNPIDPEEVSVEINLPVIQWQQYLNLSKHKE